MKTCYTISFIFFIFAAWGQQDTILHHHKFQNGKTSTIVVLKENREGYAKAYNFQGKEIYHSDVRRFAGHASVTFKHNDNGIVKEAYYSSHPDGGIQWYRSWTTFDDQGNKIGERVDNWDDQVTVPTHRIPDSLLYSPTVPRVKPDVQPHIKPAPKVEPVPELPHEPILNPQPTKKEIGHL